MDLYVVDFETYWAPDYTLSKLTTEAYVRDPRFEVILVGIQKNLEEPYWVDSKDVGSHLRSLDLNQHAVLCHHAQFDGLILSHHFDIRPAIWFDTLSMGRALHSAKESLRLGALAEKYGLASKGDEVNLTKGLRRQDFGTGQLRAYGAYCCQDVSLAFKLFEIMRPSFCMEEMKLIDRFIRMFTEPVLQLNVPLLQEYMQQLEIEKKTALLRAGVQLHDVSSNEKFADALRFLGIDPPLKTSPRTGKLTYAFAKTDLAMQELAEYPDDNVQALIAARLKNKTTINYTRAQRMIDMMQRGPACVYIKYYGARQTGRASGGDKMNWQNFTRGSKLREAIYAPSWHRLVVGDSSNIESRMLDYIAGQEDQVEAYRRFDAGLGPDIYCVMAEKIYHRPITADDVEERQMGKVTKLGLGFGMAAPKFVFAVRGQTGKKIKISLAESVVETYRDSHRKVMGFHRRCEQALWRIMRKEYGVPVDFRGIISTCEDGLLLPNGLKIRYPQLTYDQTTRSFKYFNGKTWEHIYGGKVCENIVQALARIIVMNQTIMVPLKRKLVMHSHDEGVWCVPTLKVERTMWEVGQAFRTPMEWCPDMPLNCKVHHHRVYGKAKG